MLFQYTFYLLIQYSLYLLIQHSLHLLIGWNFGTIIDNVCIVFLSVKKSDIIPAVQDK